MMNKPCQSVVAVRPHSRRSRHYLVFLFYFVATGAFAADLRQSVDSYLSQSESGHFSGTILVAQKQKILLLQSYGSAERDLEVPNRPDLIYRIGSLTKPFTAVGILRLVQRNRIHLSDSICLYISSCPAQWRLVTIEDLLDHTSGIPDLFKELSAVPIRQTGAELKRVLETSTHLALLSQPGTKYQYSNFNFILLGVLIENASGASWEDFLREEVFKRALLEDTRYDDVWAVIPRRVEGYRREDGGFKSIAYKDHAAYSAGGLLSSAKDLLKFSRALFEGDLLDPAQLADMTRPRLQNYGLGLQIIELNGRKAYNHTGGIDGFSSHLQYYPQEKVTVVVLANTEDEPVKKIATAIAGFVVAH